MSSLESSGVKFDKTTEKASNLQSERESEADNEERKRMVKEKNQQHHV